MLSREILDNALRIGDEQAMPMQTQFDRRKSFVLAEWLLEVKREFKCKDNTYVLAVTIFNAFLNVSKDVSLDHLQGYGISCFMIAVKLSEIYSPNIDNCIWICDGVYTKNQILQFYSTIMNSLNGNVYFYTPIYLIELYSVVTNELSNAEKNCISKIFCVLIQGTVYWKYKPSRLTHIVLQMVKTKSKYNSEIFTSLSHLCDILCKNYDFQFTLDEVKSFVRSIRESTQCRDEGCDSISSPSYPTRKSICISNNAEKIGEGSHSTVYLEFCDNEPIALKKLKIKHISECAAEISAMKILNHKNIRSCRDFYFSPNEILISMQYGECSLSEILYGKENIKTGKLEYWDDIYLHGHAFLSTIEKERVSKFRIQILQALHHIHSHGIIHGDIKTANIIVTKDDNIQIIDFGASICYDTGRTEERHLICAQGYRSYRLLKDFGCFRNLISVYSTGVDIWATAIIFLELETGVFPVYGDAYGQCEKIDFLVKERKLDFLPDDTLRKLLLEMFHYDEQTRISARECLSYF